ncbi:MAG: bacteriohemerythrin [Rhodocyclales bacterium]|nr:bacteriohemerythrin [Rhodocyclales bacterium]
MNGVRYDGNVQSGSWQPAAAGGAIDAFDIFPWSSDFETGIGFMDEQHQTLVRLLNVLARRLVQPSASQSCDDVLKELSEYAAYHFEAEEALMRQYLPGDTLETSHRSTHEAFVAEIGRLKALTDEAPESAPIERLVGFLSHWLAYHILDMDRRMATVVRAMQAGTPLAEAKLQTERSMSAVLGTHDVLSARTLQLMKEVVQRKRIEGELRAQQAYLATVIESALDAAVTMNARGIITGWNAQAEKVFGWSREEAIGRRLDETIIPQRFHTDHAIGVAGFLATGDGPLLNRRIETAARHRDGHEFAVELSVTPIATADGYDFSAFVRDITERKLHEAELEKYRLHLEELVKQRTADLTLAKEAAEAANRAKSAFLATMSHELRTPMNGIIGMTDLALRRATDPTQQRHLDMVRTSSAQLLTMINDILDLAKIEAERLTLERQQFSLDTVLDNLRTLFAAKAAERQLSFVIDVAPALMSRQLLGDPLRLAQILVNLTGNAFKFTGQGSVTVRARVAEDRPDDLLLRFEVADTGIGISPEDQQRVFAAFEQADSSTTRQYGGAGLGLPLSKRLAQLMGGDIGVSSQVRAGSTFWFTASLGKAART